jgi:type II secretory pathway pseudopilin PulG
MRVSARARSESAFTLIETIMAAVLLLIVAAALAGVLTSSIAAHTTARERTLAEQAVNDQIESIRNLEYADVGIDCTTGTPCNPPGDVDASEPLVKDGLTATVSTLISYIGDPTPTSYATNANYKKVTVTATRDRDGKQLAQGVTYIAPVSRAPFGGINKSIVNVQVMDFKPNSPLPGAVVTIDNGPDPLRTDLADTNGLASFAAMTPTGPSEYYDLSATLAGYDTLPVDLPPASVAHLQVAPSQTAPTSQIRLFKPGTINVRVESSPGVLYTAGTVTVQVTSSTPLNGNTSSFTTTNGLLAVTVVAGQKIVPGVSYSIKALTSTPLCATLSAPTWSNYPADPTTTATLVLAACPSGSLTVNVQQLGANAPNAIVHLTGGPNNITVSPDPTTDSSGNVTFTGIPAGSGYTVTATRSTNASTTTAVTVAGPNNVTITLPDPPTGTVTVNVTQLSAPASAATVTITGGSFGISASGSTNSSGQIIFTNVPTGSGYTVTALKGTTVSTTTAAPNTVNLTLPNPPAGSVQLTVKWLGALVTGATVQVTGGPYGISQTMTTTATGVVTFPSVPLGSGYTFTATKNGQTTSLSSQTVVASTTGTINLPTATLTVTATWAGNPALSAAVSVSGGPNSPQTYTGTTDAVTGIATITVPTTTSNNYTVTVTKGTGSGSSTVTSVPGAGAATTVTLTPTATLTVTATWAGLAAGLATVSVTGGPNSPQTYTGTTDAITGIAAITVPVSTTNYTITVTKNTGSGSATSTVPAGGAAKTVTLTPVKTVTITVQQNSGAYASKSVVISITGGPNGTAGAAPAYSTSPTPTNTSSTSTVTVSIPAATGYTYTVRASVGTTCSTGTNKTGTNTLSAAAATTTVTVNMASSLTCPYTT